MDTAYQLSQVAAFGDIVEHALVKKAQNLPGLEHFDQVLLVVAVLRAVRPLQNEADYVRDVGRKLSDVLPLDVFHDVVHYVKVYHLTLLVLTRPQSSNQKPQHIRTYISNEFNDDVGNFLRREVMVDACEARDLARCVLVQ